MSSKESMEPTKQEDALMELFVNFFLETVLSGGFEFSDDIEEIQVTVTEEFLTKLRNILNEK